MIVRKCPKCGKIIASEMSGKPHPHGEIYEADRYNVPSVNHYDFTEATQEQRQRMLNDHPEWNLDKRATWGVTTILDYKSGGYATSIRLRIPDVSKQEAIRRAEVEALKRNPLLVIRKTKTEILEK